MSIRGKLLVACTLLIAVIVGAGIFSEVTQQRIAKLGIDIYDRAFLAMSYLRSSQNALQKLGVSLGGAQLEGKTNDAAPPEATLDERSAQRLDQMASRVITDIVSDTQVANERAMSSEGAAATRDLIEQLTSLDRVLHTHDLAAARVKVEQVQAAFDTAVEIYAGDGYVYRRNVQRLVDASYRETGAALAAAAAVAIGITLALGASIIPALRKAVEIARAISGGQLDKAFPTTGSDEIAILMRALSNMRDSLVDKIGRIDALAMETQTRAAELSRQNARFEAALENMHHGLCMIDNDHRLTVANQRYAEMFGEPHLGSDVLGMSLFATGDGIGTDGAVKELDDGRVIRVASRPVQGGGSVVTFEDITDRHRAESRLHHMSRHDALTGLPNRVLFREELSAAMDGKGFLDGPSLLSIDLDGFKSVNDTLGHGVGDELLRTVAARLLDHLSPSETIARLGGDEFALILRCGDEALVERRARDLILALQQPFDIPPHHIVIGASVGCAIRRDPACGDTGDPGTFLLKNADVALYRAKADGRGTCRIYSDALDATFSERRELEADLRTALERQEFALLFQPIVRAADGVVVGFEALLRWHHPSRGVISPETFIPIAEDSGLITPIGRWVLHGACSEAARWPSDLRVAVNLSPVQFRQGFLEADVRRALSDARLAPDRLELEITESVLLRDEDAVISTLLRLRSTGIRIALDDFGTGYSSLSYLRKLPFDKIKIDRSFVQNLTKTDNASILQAMVGLGKALNVAVLAEGVETTEQAERLKKEGCTELQGYLFGKPGPASQVREVVSRLSGLKETTKQAS